MEKSKSEREGVSRMAKKRKRIALSQNRVAKSGTSMDSKEVERLADDLRLLLVFAGNMSKTLARMNT